MKPPVSGSRELVSRRVQAADKAWTDAINVDPSNSSAWSNRGTSRLQFGRWDDARSDLKKALELETQGGGKPSGLLLNQLGNSDGAVGDWELACSHYKQAAELSPEIESIALANLALGQSQRGVRAAPHDALAHLSNILEYHARNANTELGR